MSDDPTTIEAGIAENIETSAFHLSDDAAAYRSRRNKKRCAALITSMRIMRHRLDKAFREAGIEP